MKQHCVVVWRHRGPDLLQVILEVGPGVPTVDQGRTVAAGAFASHGGGYAEFVWLPCRALRP